MDGHLPSPAEAESRVAFGPAPSPFDVPVVTGPERPSDDMVQAGLVSWRMEFGHDLTGPERVWTLRQVLQVMTTDGFQGAANVNVDFDPACERLVFHTVSVTRDGERREAAVRDAFQYLRREQNMERAMFDGRITAHMVIPDVRVGDVIETCYSIIGENPALKGQFAAAAPLQWNLPAVSRTYRLKAPAGRKFSVRTWGVEAAYEETEQDGAVTRTWTLEPAEAFQYERDTPSWWVGHCNIQVADEADWAQIADIFREYYTPPEQLPPALEAEAAKIETECADLAERTRRALRLVQSQIRYHSIGIGAGGFVPRPVEEIWSTRFGDCKDTSRILTALLRRLGVEACPTLVSVNGGVDLDQSPPSSRAFDHCIVKAVVDGKTYWLEPTCGIQGGTLDVMFQYRYAHVLPLVENATLEFTGDHVPVVIQEVDESWDFPRDPSDPAEAEFRMILRSWRADETRRQLLNDGRETVARRMREYHEQHYGEAETVTPTTFEDDEDANEIVVVEKYRFLKPWREAEQQANLIYFSTADDVVAPNLLSTESPNRKSPIGLGPARIIRTARTLNYATPMGGSAWDSDWKGPGVRYIHKCETLSASRHRVTAELTIEKHSVPPEDAKQFFDFCRKARSSTGYVHQARTHRGGFAGERKKTPLEKWSWLIWAVIFGSVLLFGALSGL